MLRNRLLFVVLAAILISGCQSGENNVKTGGELSGQKIVSPEPPSSVGPKEEPKIDGPKSQPPEVLFDENDQPRAMTQKENIKITLPEEK